MKENIIGRIKIKLIEDIGRNLRQFFYIPSILTDQTKKENFRNFNRNICDNACGPPLNVNAEAVDRIIQAYDLAMRDLQRPDLYYATNEWLPIYRKNLAPLILALQKKDAVQVANLLSQFFRKRISLGFAGLPKMQERFFLKAPSFFWKSIYINDLLHRWRLLQELIPGVKATDLQAQNIGNGYGLHVDEAFVPANSDYHYYYSEIISVLLKDKESPRVLELGGGFGGMARYLLGKTSASRLQYVGLDLPEALAISSFFLMHSFPQEKICLYGEKRQDEVRIKLWPSYMIEEIAQNKEPIDLFFNSYSLAEMGDDAIDNYVSKILKVSPKYIYHVNHTRNARRNSKYFFCDDMYARVAENKARWNEGNSVTSDEYEFLYARRS